MGSRPSSIAFHRSRLERSAESGSDVGGAGGVVPPAHLGPGADVAHRDRRGGQRQHRADQRQPVPRGALHVDVGDAVGLVGVDDGIGRGQHRAHDRREEARCHDRHQPADHSAEPSPRHQQHPPGSQDHQSQCGGKGCFGLADRDGDRGDLLTDPLSLGGLRPGLVAGNSHQRAGRQAHEHYWAERAAAFSHRSARRRSRYGCRCGRQALPGRPAPAGCRRRSRRAPA